MLKIIDNQNLAQRLLISRNRELTKSIKFSIMKKFKLKFSNLLENIKKAIFVTEEI